MLTRFTLLCLSICVGHALAGSRIWQPPVGDKPTVQKRYFHVKPDAGVLGYESTVWPDKTIRVCYADTATRDKYHIELFAAHQVWLRAGLGSDFKIEEATSEECGDREKLKDIMLVSDGPYLASTVGFPADPSLRRNAGRGPTMQLNDNVAVGMLNRVSNYAHELGHALGLYHEHQNPNFWKGPGIENALDGSVFGPAENGNWRCMNLKDYNSHVTGLVVQTPRGGQTVDRTAMCRDWGYAKSAGFSAYDYLPMPASIGSTQPGKSGSDVDWASIMIYPSGAGAVDGSGDPADPRKPILLDHNGKRIPINLSPSKLDIHALRGMYGVESSDGRKLINKLKKFPKIFDLSKGQAGGCN